MEPFYFRKSSKPLFGIYHPPEISITCNVGIVLCHPMGQEYIRSHRSLLQLAKLLSSEGFHVLRFDYYSCGDSEGSCNQGSIKQWVADISTAANELTDGCEIEKICLVGLRLGGALAMIAGTKRGDVDSIVLWDPVINGTTYLQELKHLHNEWLHRSFAKPLMDHKSQKVHEILGFPITESMTEELVNMNLLALEEKPANNILIIESEKVTENRWLREHLRAIDVESGYEYVPFPNIWIKKSSQFSNGLVPIPVLKRIVKWISEIYR